MNMIKCFFSIVPVLLKGQNILLFRARSIDEVDKQRSYLFIYMYAYY